MVKAWHLRFLLCLGITVTAVVAGTARAVEFVVCDLPRRDSGTPPDLSVTTPTPVRTSAPNRETIVRGVR
jgi:hypothetical protein